MALDTAINRAALIAVFPDLAADTNFKILSECTNNYNCIAWAMGYTDRWVDHFIGAGHWWPNGVQRDTKPETLIAAFKAEGFEMSENAIVEEGYSKVVLYKKATSEEWTHAARIVSNEIEYSKFGPAWDGQHSHNVLCNTGIGQERQSYGIAFAYMKRRVMGKDMKSELTGSMKVNVVNLAKMRSLLGK